ncbi:hypothetical protein GGR58DRAFT_485602 [Xylaria digitata]|nr:hypothetical protein GGR58DRAFT_485602 [Xylaria digitata]
MSGTRRPPAGLKWRFWLRDGFPRYVPEARIFLCGHSATKVQGHDRDTLIGDANKALEAIRVNREGIRSRSIIFSYRSMRGLLQRASGRRRE